MPLTRRYRPIPLRIAVCIGVCFGQIFIVIHGKIVHTAGERTNNGKSASPTLLSIGIDLFAAINILSVSNHVIDTLADQFSYGCLFFRCYLIQNSCLILCQLYLYRYHHHAPIFSLIWQILSASPLTRNGRVLIIQAGFPAFYHICGERTRHLLLPLFSDSGVYPASETGQELRLQKPPAHCRPDRQMLV